MGTIVSAAMLFGAVLFAQTPSTPAARPTYEAAVIKPNTSGSGNSSTHGTRGQIVFTNVSLRRLVERALQIRSFQLVAPTWMDDPHFDISAKYPIDSKPEDRLIMLKTLLEDRFGLVVHEESKEAPGYVLAVAKNGFKLKPVEDVGGQTNDSNNNAKEVNLHVERMSMDSFANYLTSQVDSMVVNKTGVSGVYSFDLKWATERAIDNAKLGDADPGPSLFNVLQEVLGLKLQAEKVPTPIFIVDKIERTPTDN